MTSPSPSRPVFSVSEITRKIQQNLEQEFSEVWVQGQISNFRKPGSGHFYFVLKDEKSQLRSVMFKFQNLYMRFVPEDGMEVICRGRIGIYAPRGEYQLIVDQMEPLGVGALHVRFEQIKAKLEREGLFQMQRKRPLPYLPRRIAIITSPTGAAIRDMLRVLTTKDPGLEVLLIPSRVQGEGSAQELADAIELANREDVANPADGKPLELLIIGRGGGSVEDLWAFNEEVLARAIAGSELPVISAVGHETDLSIADMVADYRAATPTAAAELVAGNRDRYLDQVDNLMQRLYSATMYDVQSRGEQLNYLSRMLQDPRRSLQQSMQRVDELVGRAQQAQHTTLTLRREQTRRLQELVHAKSPAGRLREWRSMVDNQTRHAAAALLKSYDQTSKNLQICAGRLDALSPLNTLARGFGITRVARTGEVVTDVSQVEIGQDLEIALHRGFLDCRVQDKRKD